jgi:hypothetical protein
MLRVPASLSPDLVHLVTYTRDISHRPLGLLL